ncbi:hypothetical protein, partial [Megamonas funiformis]|uniref:hypothetical protein n=1 Tax=Megamonas funiformis TaxID=437897 RepID=UPI001AD7EBAC
KTLSTIPFIYFYFLYSSANFLNKDKDFSIVSLSIHKILFLYSYFLFHKLKLINKKGTADI